MRTKTLLLALLAVPLFAACERPNTTATAPTPERQAASPETTMQQAPPAAGVRPGTTDLAPSETPSGQTGEPMQQPPAQSSSPPGASTPYSAPSGSPQSNP